MASVKQDKFTQFLQAAQEKAGEVVPADNLALDTTTGNALVMMGYMTSRTGGERNLTKIYTINDRGENLLEQLNAHATGSLSNDPASVTEILDFWVKMESRELEDYTLRVLLQGGDWQYITANYEIVNSTITATAAVLRVLRDESAVRTAQQGIPSMIGSSTYFNARLTALDVHNRKVLMDWLESQDALVSDTAVMQAALMIAAMVVTAASTSQAEGA